MTKHKCPVCRRPLPEIKDVDTLSNAPSNGTETSDATAEMLDASVRVKQRIAILNYIHEDEGPVREDLSINLGIPPHSVNPRVWELLGSGGRFKPVIEERGIKLTRSNRPAKRLYPIEKEVRP